MKKNTDWNAFSGFDRCTMPARDRGTNTQTDIRQYIGLPYA